MFQHVHYLMVNVSNMARSVAFYRDTLGLPLRFESPGWSEFDTGTTTLALHLSPPPPAKDATHGAAETVAGTCLIGLSVPNLDQACEELRGRGVRFAMMPTDRPEEGIRLAVCLDPDGLAISIAQPQ